MQETVGFKITEDVSQAVEALRFLRSYGSGDIIPGLAEAIEKSTMYVQGGWVRNASGIQVDFDGRSFKVNRVTGQYVRSIQAGLVYPMSGNAYWGRIQSTCPYAVVIEKGRKARTGQEVRAAMLKSPKAKTSKDGSRYLIIPFRHGTPGAVTMKPMPPEIYEQAKKLKRSTLGTARISGNLVSHGGSLNKPWESKKFGAIDPIQYGRRSKIMTAERPFAPYTWKAGPYAGMKKVGEKGHTGYMTFRVISSKTPNSSEAWAQPEIKPRPVAQASAKQATPQVIQYIRDGVLRG